MTTVLAAMADEIFRDAFLTFLPVAGVSIVFGVVYWLIRRRKAAREQAARTKAIIERRGETWFAVRKAKRDAEMGPPRSR